MRRISTVLATAAVAVAAFGSVVAAAPGDCRLIRGAATPDDPSDDVSVCELQTYFHRAGPGLANLGNVPSFNATPPTAVDPAPYAGLLGRLVATDNRVRPTFEGSFTGNIDTLRVDAYVSAPLYNAAGIGYPLIFDITVDGEAVFVENPAAGSEQDIPMQPTSQSGIYKLSFAVKNLHKAMETAQLKLGPDVRHTVRLSMTTLYYGDGNHVHWFDSASTPAGIYFNVNNPKGVVYDAAAA